MVAARFFVLTLAVLIGLASGCASVDPFGKDRAVLADDEKRIWNRSIEEAKKLDESGEIFEGRELVEYVNDVARKVIPEELRGRDDINLSVRIIRSPFLNAFALSHGAIYIYTGMLAKLDNEAQLAAILAHELTHITHRHPVQHFRTVQNITTALAVLQLGTLPAGGIGSAIQLLGALGATAAVTGYSRSMEAEADDLGLKRMIDAGYDPSAAPSLFDYLQKELGDRKIDEPFVFGSHPKLQERKDNYSALIAKNFTGKSGRVDKERYDEMVNPILLLNAQMDLALGRWSWAEEAIRRSIALKPDDPKGLFHLGELMRRRAEPGDLEKAENQYRRAIELDSSFALAHQGLGLIYLKLGNAEKALDEFRIYLSLAPHADDRAYVEQYLANSPNVKGGL